MSEEEIMSEEAFKELIDNLEIIEKLTPYGRKAIKYWVNKLQKENEVLKRAFDKQSGDIGNYLVELQQKDKQIDLITSFIYKALCEYPGTISHALRKSGFNDDECANCEPADKKICKDCIKQYFEQKAKEKGE